MSDLCKEMAKMGKGIGNENRYHILMALMGNPKMVGDIAEKVGLSQPAISQNLKILKTANLVEDERRGQEVYYSINVAYMASLLHKLATDIGKSKKK